MTSSTPRRPGTDAIIDPLGGGREMGLPLLGIMAEVMSQIPGMNRQHERPADEHPDAVRPHPQAHTAATVRGDDDPDHAPRPDAIRPRGTTRSRADTMKTITGARDGAGVRIDGNG